MATLESSSGNESRRTPHTELLNCSEEQTLRPNLAHHMVGRLDDWLKVVMEKENIAVDPGYLEWAGVAAFKKTYQIFRERGYRIRLLSAAFRNHMHWSEFIGGDVVISSLLLAAPFQR
jgi:transaldolase